MNNFEGLSIHSLTIILNAMRAAAPTLADKDDPVRVAILEKIEKIREQE
jgi:hypothetical protein